MNKDEFSNLIKSKVTTTKAESESRSLINQVRLLFSQFTTKACEDTPDSIDMVDIIGSSDDLSVKLNVLSDSLSYVFENEKVMVRFNQKTVDSYTLNGTNMISEKHKHPFELSDVEQELNNFK